MLLTVYCVRRDLSELTFSLEVDGDFELENFRALCELESGIPAAETQIVYAERPLTDNQRSLSSYGLKDGDVVILRQKDPAEPRAPATAAPFPGLPRIDFSSIAVPGTSNQAEPAQPAAPPPDSTSFPHGLDNPVLLREMLLANPHELSLLKERNPPLAEALLSGDIEKFTKVLLEQQQERARREQERIRLFSADPFDLEAQAKIEEDIRQQNIEENMTIAMEEAPESFGQVVMLYINCKVNGYPVKAFVDSGAQMTIMSQACAERCHIMRLVDRRWAGIAKGVGTQKIIGRVHLAQVQIEGDFLPCSFSILEEQPMDMLLGLDMLKRHQCSIDLEKNVLVIGTTGTRTSFLPEGELPECARLAYGPGRDDVHPEEIADRELAEVLQKSAEEADTETTSEDDRSLAVPSDGPVHPAHSPDITSEAVAPSASAVCARPSTATESIEPTTNLLTTGISGAEHQDFLTQTEVLPPHPPPVTEPAAGGNADDMSVSHIDQTDRDLQVTSQLMTNPEHQDDSLPNSTDNTLPLQPGDSEDTHRSFPPHGHTVRPELCVDCLPQCHATGQSVGDESPLGSAEAPMDVDVSTADASYEITVGPARDAAGLTDQEKDAAISCGNPAQVTGGDVSDEVNGTSKESVSQPLRNPNQDVEGNCFSLAAALKELHKLLVVSGQGPCRAVDEMENHSNGSHEIPGSRPLPPDHLPQNNAPSVGNHSASDETFLFDQAGHSGASSDQDPAGTDPLASSEHYESMLGLDSTDPRPGFTSAVGGPETLRDRLTSDKSDWPSELPDATSGGLTQQDGGHVLESSPTDDLESEAGVNGTSVEDQDHPSAGADATPPPVFSQSDIEKIVNVGFSTQDAILALENAGGNADLALLALLAKNIAVPRPTGS